jgi:hypothetical protein
MRVHQLQALKQQRLQAGHVPPHELGRILYLLRLLLLLLLLPTRLLQAAMLLRLTRLLLLLQRRRCGQVLLSACFPEFDGLHKDTGGFMVAQLEPVRACLAGCP